MISGRGVAGWRRRGAIPRRSPRGKEVWDRNQGALSQNLCTPVFIHTHTRYKIQRIGICTIWSCYILTFETEIKVRCFKIAISNKKNQYIYWLLRPNSSLRYLKNCHILNLTHKPSPPNQVRYLKHCHIERQESRVQFEDDGSQKTVSYKRKVEIEISKINDWLSFPLLM